VEEVGIKSKGIIDLKMEGNHRDSLIYNKTISKDLNKIEWVKDFSLFKN